MAADACKWCDQTEDLGRDFNGDRVCRGCFDAMERSSPEGRWSRELALDYRREREERKRKEQAK